MGQYRDEEGWAAFEQKEKLQREAEAKIRADQEEAKKLAVAKGIAAAATAASAAATAAEPEEGQESTAHAPTKGPATPAVTARASRGSLSHPGSRTFASSAYKRLYMNARTPDDDVELLLALKNFLLVYAKQANVSPDGALRFFGALRREALAVEPRSLDDDPFESAAYTASSAVAAAEAAERARLTQQRLLEQMGDVARYAQRLWTSVATAKEGVLRGRELCSLINDAIRRDDPDLLQHLVVGAPQFVLARAINSLCVVNRKVHTISDAHWPRDGRCFRGTGMPDKWRGFFKVGVKYRVPGYLATSFSETVALRFAKIAFHANDGQLGAALWTVQVDPMGGRDIERRCLQVNYVTTSNMGDQEREFLFAPYSVFTVTRIDWAGRPTYLNPHKITIVAALDNLVEDEDLPLAPWY